MSGGKYTAKKFCLLTKPKYEEVGKKKVYWLRSCKVHHFSLPTKSISIINQPKLSRNTQYQFFLSSEYSLQLHSLPIHIFHDGIHFMWTFKLAEKTYITSWQILLGFT